MTAYLSREQIIDTFRLFDADGSGAIDRDELCLVLKSLGINASKFEVEQMMRKIDKDANGVIDEDEFETILKENMAAKDTEAEMKRAFELFTNDERTMTSDHVGRVYGEIGMDHNEERINMFIEEGSQGGRFVKLNDWFEIHTGQREPSNRSRSAGGYPTEPEPEPMKMQVLEDEGDEY